MEKQIISKEKTCICGKSMRLQKFKNIDEVTWKCNSCMKRKSIRSRSFFERSHLSLGSLLMLIYSYLNYPLIQSNYYSDQWEIPENMIVDWKSMIRDEISKFLTDNPIVLGKKFPVQIDESLFGKKRKYGKGKRRKTTFKTWVFGMIEEETNLNVLYAVKNRNKHQLIPLIKDHIVPGATIKSDEWSSYRTLEKEGFDHLKVNHSIGFSQNDVDTNKIEGMWKHVKKLFVNGSSTRLALIQPYLDFFSFFSYAKSLGKSSFDLFLEVLKINYDLC